MKTKIAREKSNAQKSDPKNFVIETLRERLRERLETLDIPITRAGELAGYERTFLVEFLNGKKQSLAMHALPAIARVLNCDSSYLLGEQDEARRFRGASGALKIKGYVELGSYRDDTEVDLPAPILADPRWAADRQFAMQVRDLSADELVSDGGILHCITPDRPPQHAEHIILATNRNGLREITVRHVVHDELWLPCKTPRPESLKPVKLNPKTMTVLGRVVASYQRWL